MNGAYGIDGVTELMACDDIEQELSRAKERCSDTTYANRIDLLFFVYEHYVLERPFDY